MGIMEKKMETTIMLGHRSYSSFHFIFHYPYMGGCQNYGPFWIPIIIRHLIFGVPQKGP